jgi:hypothetical protein
VLARMTLRTTPVRMMQVLRMMALRTTQVRTMLAPVRLHSLPAEPWPASMLPP